MVKFLIQVEVKSTEVKVMDGVAKRTGKAYHMEEQSAWVDLGKEYPQEMRFVLPSDSHPLPVGRYYLNERSLYIDRNGALCINVRNMTPVPQPAAIPAQGTQK